MFNFKRQFTVLLGINDILYYTNNFEGLTEGKLLVFTFIHLHSLGVGSKVLKILYKLEKVYSRENDKFQSKVKK